MAVLLWSLSVLSARSVTAWQQLAGWPGVAERVAISDSMAFTPRPLAQQQSSGPAAVANTRYIATTVRYIAVVAPSRALSVGKPLSYSAL